MEKIFKPFDNQYNKITRNPSLLKLNKKLNFEQKNWNMISLRSRRSLNQTTKLRDYSKIFGVWTKIKKNRKS